MDGVCGPVVIAGGTRPDPSPNPAAKTPSAHGTAHNTVRESKTPPNHTPQNTQKHVPHMIGGLLRPLPPGDLASPRFGASFCWGGQARLPRTPDLRTTPNTPPYETMVNVTSRGRRGFPLLTPWRRFLNLRKIGRDLVGQRKATGRKSAPADSASVPGPLDYTGQTWRRPRSVSRQLRARILEL